MIDLSEEVLEEFAERACVTMAYRDLYGYHTALAPGEYKQTSKAARLAWYYRHRDEINAKRAKTDRPYTRLDTLTPEERAERKRVQRNASAKRCRERRKRID